VGGYIIPYVVLKLLVWVLEGLKLGDGYMGLKSGKRFTMFCIGGDVYFWVGIVLYGLLLLLLYNAVFNYDICN
jgi:hypothetical protein